MQCLVLSGPNVFQITIYKNMKEKAILNILLILNNGECL